MFPRMLDEFRIKGYKRNFFLLSLESFKEYSINDSQTEVLLLCDGSNSMEDIIVKTGFDRNSLQKFIEEMKQSGFIVDGPVVLTPVLRKCDPLEAVSPYLKEVHLDITSHCNLSCLHCYQNPYLQIGSSEMTNVQIKSLIDELAEMNVARLVISGGEPFLRKDLWDIIGYSLHRGIIVPTIFTNGTIYNADLKEICRSGKPIALAISLDGYSNGMHDYIRGEGAFGKTIDNIRLILEEKERASKTEIVINTMMHPLNFRFLKEMFIYLSELGIYRWRVSLPRDQGSFTANYDRLKIDVSEVLSEYEKFITWYLEEGRFISNMDIQIESFFRTSVVKGREINTFKQDSLCCEYKKQALAIKPNGDVTACTAFTNLVIGNLQQDSIRKIWYSKKMQETKQIKVSHVTECADCEFLYLCGTGCRRMALSKKGSLYAKDESACEIYKFIHNKIIPIFDRFQLQIGFD